MKLRRLLFIVFSLVMTASAVYTSFPVETPPGSSVAGTSPALTALDSLEVKGRAPKTGYSRDAFGSGWQVVNGCDTRQIILFRDLYDTLLKDECTVQSGTLNDPYTGKVLQFSREQSDAVQIDHVVALSDAWQKGAQNMSRDQRIALANDPLELLAVDGAANQAKGDADAASWLPPYRPFRCEYVARQIAVKQRYSLWVTAAEKQAMQTVLSDCPDVSLPVR